MGMDLRMSPSARETPDWVRLDHEGLNIIIEASFIGEKFQLLREYLPPSGLCQHWPLAITMQCSSEDDIEPELARLRGLIRLVEASIP